MTEEEKKAIEWLKNKPDECTNIINSSSYIGDKKAYAKERTNFKTVLNLITKLQKENVEKDRQIKTLNHTNKTYKGMLNKQSAQIDLIAFSLADYVMYYEYDKCRNPEMIKQKAKELKQYYETKVKEEK